jgi:hypothetical protein
VHLSQRSVPLFSILSQKCIQFSKVYAPIHVQNGFIADFSSNRHNIAADSLERDFVTPRDVVEYGMGDAGKD